MAIEPKDQLKSLLRELFQLDKTDLDFGIYRIMNLRANDTEDFIENKLPETLKKVTGRLADKGKKEIEAEVSKRKAELIDFALENYEKELKTDWELNLFIEKNKKLVPVKKYLEAKEAFREDIETTDAETAVYNDLYNFFNRYYEGGDFISKPRAGESKYMIPYNGEEVKFYWANHDQYYIKTGENFRNYVFTNELVGKASVTVEFRLIDAETAVNNNKESKDRRFIPIGDNYFDWDIAKRTLTLKFHYKALDKEEKEKWGDKQNVKANNKGINENLIFNLLEEQITTTKDKYLIDLWNETRNIKAGRKEDTQNFYYHLNRYTNTNSFDYFIHKDLRKFLRRELDYFLKNEIFDLSFTSEDYSAKDAETLIKNNLTRASAIREIAFQLIDFLAELEDFQKMLFEKKKFVVQSDYCLTLDQIPEKLLDKIIAQILKDKDKKQIKEWQNLGFIKNLKIKAKDIKNDKYLVLDTQFLNDELKFKLLGSIENLDEKCSGLLINSDNFQALNFLLNKYRSKVKSIYIDPPYNSSSSEIVYKNSYKHSSWVSLMENRLSVCKRFLTKEGVLTVAIDENENETLANLLDELFSNHQRTSVTILSNPSGQQGDNFSYTHEFAHFVFPKGGQFIGLETRSIKDADVRPLRDVSKGDHLREDAANCFYPFLVKDGEIISIGDVSEDSFHPDSVNVIRDDGVIEIYPIDPQGDERKWVFARQTVETILDELSVERNRSRNILDIIRTKRRFNYKTVWTNKKYSANSYGSKLLNNILGEKRFDFPKSIFTVIDSIDSGLNNAKDGYVLDYFAGSGTTGHAVINLNREDEGDRKYILVEMGEYFDTVTKPRIQKVVYANKWKNGKPVREDETLINKGNLTDGISHIFQYIKLEQYEDTLNNIEFTEQAEDNKQAFSFAEGIRYILKSGTRDSKALLDIEKLENPFNYEMDIIRLNERKPTKVDLVTTFNFLLGIEVELYFVEKHQEREYRIIKGKRGLQEYQIIWRNFEGLDLDEERDWINKTDWFSEEAETFRNADSAFNAKSIEAEFQRLMFEDIDY